MYISFFLNKFCNFYFTGLKPLFIFRKGWTYEADARRIQEMQVERKQEEFHARDVEK